MRPRLQYLALPVAVMACLFGFRAAQASLPTCKDMAISALGADKVDDALCVDNVSKCPDSATTKLILNPNECNNNPQYPDCCAFLKAAAAPAAAPTSTSSAGGGSGSATTLANPLGTGATFYTVIQRVISAFLGMVGALALLVFVYAGILWMTAGGEPKRVQSAKDAMKYAVIGIAMIAFAYVLTTFFISALTGGVPSQQQGAPAFVPPTPS